MFLSAVKLFCDRATEGARTACRPGGFVICGRTPEPLMPVMSMMSGISLLRSFESILVSFLRTFGDGSNVVLGGSGRYTGSVAGTAVIGKGAAVR
jgi:hypothetical protein